MDNLEALYCHIDDYCKTYTAEQQKKMLTLKRKSSKKTRNKPCCISLAEIITIMVLFHQIRYREFKAFYYGYLCQWLKSAFPRLPSYNRMVELMEKAAWAGFMALNCTSSSMTKVSLSISPSQQAMWMTENL